MTSTLTWTASIPPPDLKELNQSYNLLHRQMLRLGLFGAVALWIGFGIFKLALPQVFDVEWTWRLAIFLTSPVLLPLCTYPGFAFDHWSKKRQALRQSPTLQTCTFVDRRHPMSAAYLWRNTVAYRVLDATPQGRRIVLFRHTKLDRTELSFPLPDEPDEVQAILDWFKARVPNNIAPEELDDWCVALRSTPTQERITSIVAIISVVGLVWLMPASWFSKEVWWDILFYYSLPCLLIINPISLTHLALKWQYFRRYPGHWFLPSFVHGGLCFGLYFPLSIFRLIQITHNQALTLPILSQ